MEVKYFMLNGHKTCHSGQIFTLADSAFAFACNSQNQAAVALSCIIDFVNPAFQDDTLTATAEELHQGGRSGVYQIKIAIQNQQLIALFKGNSARIKRSTLPEESVLSDTK
jgi:acyl-CoA thioesterase